MPKIRRLMESSEQAKVAVSRIVSNEWVTWYQYSKLAVWSSINRTMTLQFLVVMFLLATVDGAFDRDHRHPQCSKEWIRYLVLNACNYSKRHTEVLQYIIEESIKDVHLKFNKTLGLAELSPLSRATGKITEIIPEGITAERKSKNDESERSSFGTLVDLENKDLMEELGQIGEEWVRRARSIKSLVERCCIKLCKEEDFKVLCFV